MYCPKMSFYIIQEKSYTRIVEYKKLTKHKSNTSLLGIEYPSKNGRHYPVPTKKGYNLAGDYIERLPDNFYSIGRAGRLYAIDMDDCVEQAPNYMILLNQAGRRNG